MSTDFILNDYIESGVIEEYCLGLLDQASVSELNSLSADYPEISQKIEETLAALGQLSANHFAASIKSNSLAFLDRHLDSASLDPTQLPVINQYADLRAWSQFSNRHTPSEIDGPLKTKIVYEDHDRVLTIAWLSDELIEEGHPLLDFEESFFILEGSCECNVGGNIFSLEAGDFFKIPPLTRHSIRNTSSPDLGYVKAIIQRLKVA